MGWGERLRAAAAALRELKKGLDGGLHLDGTATEKDLLGFHAAHQEVMCSLMEKLGLASADDPTSHVWVE